MLRAKLSEKLGVIWRAIRRLSGDDAYEQYLKRHAEHHPDALPVSRGEFFKQWQDGKWTGVKRCC